MTGQGATGQGATGGLHHVELWVPDVARADRSWGWLLQRLGWVADSRWSTGVSYRCGPVYLVLERGPDVLPVPHERRRPGLNHLALHAGTPSDLDDLVAGAGAHGWRPLFADRYPHAGGPDHYAAYLEDEDGFEVELVAERGDGPSMPGVERAAAPQSVLPAASGGEGDVLR